MSSLKRQRWSILADELEGIAEDEAYPPFEPTATDTTSREEFYAIEEGSGEVSLARAEGVGSLIKGYVQGHLSEGLSLTQRAGAAWWRANGDLEHRHTQGIYVKEYKTKAPVLYVYIDTSSLLQDFTTNKELYLARLANRGFAVSDIRFQLSRKKRGAQDALPAASAKPSPRPLKPLSPETADEIDSAASALPEDIRKSVSEALKLMVARDTDSGTQDAKESLK